MSTSLSGLTAPRSLASLTPAQFASLFSGEDEHEIVFRPRGGLWRATMDLLVDSVRTLADSSDMRVAQGAFRIRNMNAN
jgi:hypothetical protein